MTTTLNTSIPLFSCPAPSWATEPTEWYAGTTEHQRIAQRPLLWIEAWMEQVDELDVTDGTLTLIRRPATIMVNFDGIGDATYGTNWMPIDEWRNGWMPDLPGHITVERIALARDAVAELLAAYDGADR